MHRAPTGIIRASDYFRRRRRILTRARGKKMAIRPMMMARPHHDPSPGKFNLTKNTKGAILIDSLGWANQ